MVYWIIPFFTCNMYQNSSPLDQNKLQNEFTNAHLYQSGFDQYWTTAHQTVMNIDTNTVPFM